MNEPNLPQQPPDDKPDFLVGDVVVFIDAFKPDHLMVVHKVQGDGVLLNGNRNFALNHLIRTVSVAELKTGKRLGEVVWNS